MDPLLIGAAAYTVAVAVVAWLLIASGRRQAAAWDAEIEERRA